MCRSGSLVWELGCGSLGGSLVWELGVGGLGVGAWVVWELWCVWERVTDSGVSEYYRL